MNATALEIQKAINSAAANVDVDDINEIVRQASFILDGAGLEATTADIKAQAMSEPLTHESFH
jgi:hypothetical protein